MAVNHFNPTIWSARLFQALEAQSIFMGLCNRDWEEDASGAAKVKIQQISNDVTISDYTKNSDHAAPQVMTSSEQELVLDQQKLFNVYLDDIDRIQSKPDLMDEYLRKAAIAIAKEVDLYIYKLISAATPTGNVTAIDARTSIKILVGLSKMVTTLRKADVPADRPKWIVTQPDDYAQFEDGVTSQASEANLGMYLPATAEQTFRAGYQGQYKGCQMYMTNRRPGSGNLHNAGATKSEIAAGTPAAITFAYQWQNVEAYRPEARFGDAMKGLFVYAAKVVDTSQLSGGKVL